MSQYFHTFLVTITHDIVAILWIGRTVTWLVHTKCSNTHQTGTYPRSGVSELREATIVTRLRLGQTRIWFQAGAEGLPIVRNVQTRPGAHEAPYWMWTGFFPRRQSGLGV